MAGCLRRIAFSFRKDRYGARFSRLRRDNNMPR